MSQQFPALFQPLTLRHKTLRNRIVFGAHTANMSEQGLPGERHRGYYEERARGGAAMIVVEPVPVHRTAVLTRGNFRHSTDEIIPHFRKSHRCGACAWRGDLPPALSCRPARRFRQFLRAELVALGLPSFHRFRRQPRDDGSRRSRRSSRASLQAARRAKESGFDGIEIFAAYNAIVDQFWTPFNNRRNDKWGGASLENRTRFSCRDHARHPQDGGRGFHHRACHQSRSRDRGLAVDRGDAGNHRLARRAPADGLCHLRHRQLFLAFRRHHSHVCSLPTSSALPMPRR